MLQKNRVVLWHDKKNWLSIKTQLRILIFPYLRWFFAVTTNYLERHKISSRAVAISSFQINNAGFLAQSGKEMSFFFRNDLKL